MSAARDHGEPGRWPRVRRDERGVALAIYAVALVGLLTVVSMVIDLSQMRLDRRVNKKRADSAATAAIGRLPSGCTGTGDDVTCPWSAVCAARDYLAANNLPFDATTEKWSTAAATPVFYATSPCANTAAAPFTTRCTPNDPTTWAKITATARGGAISVEIRSGYVLPDPLFPEDAALTGDNSVDTGKGSCDQVAVIVKHTEHALFGGIVRGGTKTTTIRSVGRLNTVQNEEFIPSLLLLERSKCGVLSVSGSNTRVLAQPFQTYPGVIQIDSADNSGSCPSPILSSQATSGGPATVACSADSRTPGCLTTANGSLGPNVGTGTRPGRIGIYALNATHPSADIASAYPSTYGDTPAVRSSRSGRKPVDDKYLAQVTALDADAKAVITGNPSGSGSPVPLNPPGCTSVVSNSCTANGRTWLVLRQSDCNAFTTFFLIPGRASAQNIWFDCDLNVNAPLRLTGASSYIVVTHTLLVGSDFAINDPRTFYIGGTSSGNKIGLSISGATAWLRVGVGLGLDCATNGGVGHTTTVVVGDGSFNASSSGSSYLCQTFVYMANGYGKLGKPLPCTDCSGLLGSLNIGSGSSTTWTAPNEIHGRQPTKEELASTNKFEDLAFWTEAGGTNGSNSGLTGGAGTSLAGVFFMANADSFALAGNGSLPINLSAQFIATSMKVSGGAVVNLVPDPSDSVSVISFKVLLVR